MFGFTFAVQFPPDVAAIHLKATLTVGDGMGDSHKTPDQPTEDLGNSPIHYVATNGLAVWPYTNLPAAAICIQDAVDAASNSDTVLVADGVYDAGGAVVPGYSCMNRVVVAKDIAEISE